MSVVCSCEVSFLNTGLPNCIPAYRVWKKLIIVPLTANDGTKNKILSSDTLNAAFFNGKINNVDSSKRWYPLPKMKNVESTKADSILESFADQSQLFVAEGVRGFTGQLVNQSATFAGQLKAARCTDFGFYAIDGNGSLYGYTNNETGVIYPIPVDKNTWNPIWTLPTDTTVEKVTLNFQFDATLQDEYIGQIVSSDITGINLLDVSGLIDIFSEVVSCSTTALVVKMYNRYGSAFNKLPMEGLIIGDFFDTVGGAVGKLYNVTDSAAVTISSVTESPDGTYTFAFTAQTVADVLRVTPVKTGFDYTSVIATTATAA